VRILLAAALALASAAFGADAPLRVITTSSDLKSLVESVGGAEVAVEALAPPAGDPHAFELKASQILRLKGAHLVVRVGLDHEPWLAKARSTAPVLDASRGVKLLQTETPRLRADVRPHVHGWGNPHYWLDPENARPVTAAIAAELSKLRPSAAPAFEANRRQFVERLDAGLARWQEAMAPYKGTRMVVMHETWPYFAARFGLAIVGAAEPVPGVPPTASEISALIARMRSAGVHVLVADIHSDTALVNQIAHGTVARVVTLVPSVGGEPQARDYLSLFDLNVRRFTEVMAAR
jgi:ABC-type Zn uptake system ZnuABC Zn-binding protein ZnuA